MTVDYRLFVGHAGEIVARLDVISWDGPVCYAEVVLNLCRG